MLIADRFEIERELGRGGIGIVYKAFDRENNNNPVVVKVLIDQKDDGTRDWVERHFLKEAKALKLINHPGVVNLIDVGRTLDGKAFFAMEYVDGYDLRSQIDPKKGLIGDYERVARIIKELGDAISAAHEKGIYHRDLKPENVMLQRPKSFTDDEKVKVIDFGIATVKESLDEKTKTTQLLAGSLHYMSPEQLENKPSASSDIYALGAIAYEMVTGRPPFMPEAQSYVVAIVQLMQMQKNGVRIKPTALRPSLSEQAEVIILKALSFDIENRYKIARNFGNDLAIALTSNWEDVDQAKTLITEQVKKQTTDPNIIKEVSKKEELKELEKYSNTTSKSSDREETLIEIVETRIENNIKISNLNLNETKGFSSEYANFILEKNNTEILFPEETQSTSLIKDEAIEPNKETNPQISKATEKVIEKKGLKGETIAYSSEEVKKMPFTIKLGSGVLILCISVVALFYNIKSNSNLNKDNNISQTSSISSPININLEQNVQKELKYWLVWYPKDKMAKSPIKLTDEINSDIFFKSGDKVEFSIISSIEGYLYIIYEPENLEKEGNYTILFPSPKSPMTKVKANERISVMTTIYGDDKIEKIWFISSSKQILGLEQAFVRWKGKDDLGEVKDIEQEKAIKKLLNKNPLFEGISVEKDSKEQEMRLLSANNPLIYSLLLKRK